VGRKNRGQCPEAARGDAVARLLQRDARGLQMTIVNLSWQDLLLLLAALAASYFFALPLGWARRPHSDPVIGLRVFPLVSVSSCAYLFLGQKLFAGNVANEQSDVLQGLMTGIGFVGAGAIVKEGGKSRGVATAAAVWTTGAIGACVAYGYFAMAAMVSVMSLLIFRVGRRTTSGHA
jgi:putative Mg2+ transporter-C (MgtC) family protein